MHDRNKAQTQSSSKNLPDEKTKHVMQDKKIGSLIAIHANRKSHNPSDIYTMHLILQPPRKPLCDIHFSTTSTHLNLKLPWYLTIT